MRRWLAVAAAGCLLLLAGCGKQLPAGTDGNLVDDWPAMPVPQQIQPQAGACYDTSGPDLTLAEVVDCSGPHAVETTYVGHFTGPAADASSPPTSGSRDLSAAYASCSAPTRSYLGGDWHSGLVNLTITVADLPAWQGGSRWYMCVVSAIDSPDATISGALADKGSLKGGLAHPGLLAATCVNWVDHKTYITDITVISCAKPHNGEYAGYYAAPFGPFPTNRKTADKLASDGCEIAVAKFLGFASVEQDFNDTVGWLYLNFDQAQWNMGDRSTRCYAAAYTRDGKFIGSVKGIKNKPAKG